jgi:hypothetical protein
MQQRKTSSLLLGLFVSPLPMALISLLIAVYSGDLSETFIVVGFVVVGYAFVLIPLLITKGILRLASWRGLRAHFGVMFVVTFIPMLSVYKFVDFVPDVDFSFQTNSNSPQVVEFAITGVLIAALMALLNSACISVFWLITNQATERARNLH